MPTAQHQVVLTANFCDEGEAEALHILLDSFMMARNRDIERLEREQAGWMIERTELKTLTYMGEDQS